MDALIPPRLPGLLLRRPLGLGADPPWLAKADDGSWVVARRAPRPLTLPDHPALLGVFGSVTDDDGSTWVVTAYTSGSGLDRRLDRVGQVGTAAASAWGVVLAEGLACLHDHGLVHGDLCASRVLLGPRDAVLLDASCARCGGGDERADDVRALARLLEAAAGEPVGGAGGDVLEAAASGELGAAELARRLAGRRTRQAGARRAPPRHTSRGFVVAAAVVGLLAGAVVMGVRLAGAPAQPSVLTVADTLPTSPSPDGSGSPEPSVEPEPVEQGSASTEETDWMAVLSRLDAARGLAFESADPGALAGVDEAGSEAYRRDRVLVGALRAHEVTADGWASRVLSAEARAVSADRAVLLVTDIRSAYVLRDSAGEVVTRQDASPPTAWVVALSATPAGWRISSVTDAQTEAIR